MSFFNKLTDLSIPAKLTIGTIISIVAGPGLLGFATEYATHNYAISIGIRPPFEGIPYLASTIAFGSLLLSVICSIIFIIIRYTMKPLFRVYFYLSCRFLNMLSVKAPSRKNSSPKAEKFSTKIAIQHLSRMDAKTTLFFIANFSFMMAAMLLVFSYRGDYNYYSDVYSYNYTYAILFFFVTFAVSFIIVFSLLRPIILWFIAGFSALAVYSLVLINMFNSAQYENFLYAVKYGGGVNVTIQYTDPLLEEKNGWLMLRSTESLTLFDTNKNPVEVFLANVRTITYEQEMDKLK